jgi:hypothetical protein
MGGRSQLLNAYIKNLQSNISLMQKPCDEDKERERKAAEAQEREAEERARQAEAQRQREKEHEAQTIPPGWVKCICPKQHEAWGKYVNNVLWHPPSLRCK